MLEAFQRQAVSYLPGFVFSFNIADLKRRNTHLGHQTGDRDIAELERLLGELACADVLVARVCGQRWLMISRHNARERVQRVLDRYRRIDGISTGWSVAAAIPTGERRMDLQLVHAEIRRAIRCIYADVGTPDDLAAAIARIDANDHDLPVKQPIFLRDIPALPRTRWRCVSRAPAANPGCPFCAGQDFAWEDGDGSLYSGDGRCRGC